MFVEGRLHRPHVGRHVREHGGVRGRDESHPAETDHRDVGERRLVMVVLDSPNNAQRADDMRTMRAYVQSESDFSRDFEHVAPYEIF